MKGTLRGKVVSKLSLLVLVSACFLGRPEASEEDVRSVFYDYLLTGTTSNIIVLDMLVSSDDSLENAKQILLAEVEGNFIKIVQMYRETPGIGSERVRCGISRRVRVFRDEGLLFVDIEDDEIRHDVTNYLASECLGAPSHQSWAP